MVAFDEGALDLAILSRERKNADTRSIRMPNTITPPAPAEPVV
jgi:hypothetical protein